MSHVPQRQREAEVLILRYLHQRTPAPVTPANQGRGVTLYTTLTAALNLDNPTGHMALGSLHCKGLIAQGNTGLYLTCKGYEVASALALVRLSFG